MLLLSIIETYYFSMGYLLFILNCAQASMRCIHAWVLFGFDRWDG